MNRTQWIEKLLFRLADEDRTPVIKFLQADIGLKHDRGSWQLTIEHQLENIHSGDTRHLLLWQSVELIGFAVFRYGLRKWS